MPLLGSQLGRRGLSSEAEKPRHGPLGHRAFVALGSNLGDRIAMIEQACNAMESKGDVRILRTSCLWETKPMYVEDQGSFVNGACEIATSLSPIGLLDRLQSIENELGRVKVVEKGPRNIDLDILLYDNDVIETERLSVPHKLMLEREFVLRPLCEMIPDAVLPNTGPDSLQAHLARLPPSDPPLSTMTPLTPTMPAIRALHSSRRTHVMSILNLTPDSFSDGGAHLLSPSEPVNSPAHLAAIKRTLLAHISAGATIIDIGGQSTRPNAPQVPPAEELARILPAVRLARSLPEAAHVAISIDTYRASVASACVAAGAHVINDVSAGALDPLLLPTVAALGASVCLMHMRGAPDTMAKLTNYPQGVLRGVADELAARVRAAEAAGVRRWRIVLDPGVGFAKTLDQNLELLRRLGELRTEPAFGGLPWLVGTSRKGFVGRVTGVEEPRERVMGTAATVAAAVQGGADVVRVHDVPQMVETVRMADAIWRV
ncbi:folic acid synthesis protein [Diplodia corticola]|uniref:Folic acid synthesis protein FOL1 n=1 Tax=Diplodia corticola TaxID=236234 RepID=A0A1J9R846_9PEZI|nr:folic acid synthesis protein [Diplodia corticola]OJD36370.1 folic acid synthesis protein [Diplodia corticola]